MIGILVDGYEFFSLKNLKLFDRKKKWHSAGMVERPTFARASFSLLSSEVLISESLTVCFIIARKIDGNLTSLDGKKRLKESYLSGRIPCQYVTLVSCNEVYKIFCYSFFITAIDENLVFQEMHGNLKLDNLCSDEWFFQSHLYIIV